MGSRTGTRLKPRARTLRQVQHSLRLRVPRCWATGLPGDARRRRAQGWCAPPGAQRPRAHMTQKPLSTAAAERMNLVAQDEIW